MIRATPRSTRLRAPARRSTSRRRGGGHRPRRGGHLPAQASRRAASRERRHSSGRQVQRGRGAAHAGRSQRRSARVYWDARQHPRLVDCGIREARGDAASAAVEDGPYSPLRAKALRLVDEVGYADDAREEARKAAGSVRDEVRFGRGACGAPMGDLGDLVRVLAGDGSSAPVALVRATGSIPRGATSRCSAARTASRSTGSRGSSRDSRRTRPSVPWCSASTLRRQRPRERPSCGTGSCVFARRSRSS